MNWIFLLHIEILCCSLLFEVMASVTLLEQINIKV